MIAPGSQTSSTMTLLLSVRHTVVPMLAPVVKYKYMKTQSEAPTTVKLGVSRQVVIPKKLYDRLGLKPGDYLEVEEQQGRVVMTPKTLIDSRVHAAFRESMEDFKSGRYSGPFDTAEQATASLHKIAGARRARKASRR